jgi:hypothetical protein
MARETTVNYSASSAQQRNALVQHATSGELYVIREAAVWDGDQCTGTQIIASAGPIYHGDLPYHTGESATPELFDAIDNWHVEQGPDAEWLQAEMGAGRLAYRIGAR